jgi:hypothetical protein
VSISSRERADGDRWFYVVAMVFVSTLLIANTIAVKVVALGSAAVAAGILVFPVSYVVNDVLVEIYGYDRTRRVIWAGFACLALMSVVYYLSTLLPPAPFFDGEAAFDRIFSFVPRVALGSLAGYLVGSLLNAVVMSKVKVMTSRRHLWLRAIASTVVGELGDSFIFAAIAFGGTMPTRSLIIVATTGFVLKTAYETLAVPLTYLAVGWLRKKEGGDVLDAGLRYRLTP